MGINVNGVNIPEHGVYSIDVNGDGIKDGVRLMFTQSVTGKIGAEIPLLELRDENGQSVLFMDQRKLSGENCDYSISQCEEIVNTKHYDDNFVMIDGRKISSGQIMDCGSVVGRLHEIEYFIRDVVVSQSAPAFFPGQLINADDNGFMFASVGAYLTLENGAVYDISECSAHHFSSSAQIYWSIATDCLNLDSERLDAAGKLVEVGEIELAKEAYRSIGSGNNKATFEHYRLMAAEALEGMGAKSDAVNIYYALATDYLSLDSCRLDAAGKLVEVGEIELAKEAYRSIGSGNNKATFEHYRLVAADALAELEQEYPSSFGN